MNRMRQVIFIGALLALCWLLMTAVHELGHVLGASLSGGTVERLVLHPLQIPRTDVSPNPNPAVVVWLGPVLGGLSPVLCWFIFPRRYPVAGNIVGFFAGFCLIANGAYIALGSFDRVGDCGVMLRTGSPMWLLLAFGAVTIPAGLTVWHRLGSVGRFLSQPDFAGRDWTVRLCAVVTAVVSAELLLTALFG